MFSASCRRLDVFCLFVQEALDDKFAVVEEKENEMHLLKLSLREKERDVERLNNLLLHNEETINVRDHYIHQCLFA